MSTNSNHTQIFDPHLICPLCGEREALHNGKKYLSREHIPPKNLFITKTPDLVTVPSCRECNNGTSHLDVKFKISMGIYIGNDTPAFWQSTLNSLNKNSLRKKYKDEILQNTSPILTKDHLGGWSHRIKMDKEPIVKVITKIARGLHWHTTGEIIPTKTKLSLNLIKQREFLDPDVQNVLNQHGKWIRSGNNVFQTQYAIVTDKKFCSLWLFRFYNQDCFTVIIDPK